MSNSLNEAIAEVLSTSERAEQQDTSSRNHRIVSWPERGRIRYLPCSQPCRRDSKCGLKNKEEAIKAEQSLSEAELAKLGYCSSLPGLEGWPTSSLEMWDQEMLPLHASPTPNERPLSLASENGIRAKREPCPFA